ncbi:hypothetical protein MNBD_NITROSPINAE02-1836 [hydrothermal vent metagenome]|uniref:HTH marR-type domain-containing protein n=1 Tax=hydrothermal vent metagenome TaxID=652676 RepID=A0A3B1CM86_9ZZZZ
MDDFGLNQQQFIVLNTINHREPVSRKDICSNLLFEKSNVSKIVKKFKSPGYVQVSRFPDDKRVDMLQVTRSGRLTVWTSMGEYKPAEGGSIIIPKNVEHGDLAGDNAQMMIIEGRL